MHNYIRLSTHSVLLIFLCICPNLGNQNLEIVIVMIRKPMLERAHLREEDNKEKKLVVDFFKLLLFEFIFCSA